MKHRPGYFHSVETFGTVDGPGMRYVLFLAGCTLGCGFCHNRDTWEIGEKTVSVAEVLADYGKYSAFYTAAGGGLTVSGGEPLLQPDFVAALFASCRERGIHTVLDTAGFCGPDALRQVLPYTDLVMFSIKAGTRSAHLRLTGKAGSGIRENLRLAAAAVPLMIRFVIIPGVTDTERELTALAGLVGDLPGDPKLELLPYHQAGRQKWEQLALNYPLDAIPAASADDVAKAATLLERRGIRIAKADATG